MNDIKSNAKAVVSRLIAISGLELMPLLAEMGMSVVTKLSPM